MVQTGWRTRVKRILDVSLAAGGLVVASPVLVAAAVAIRVSLGSPVLFRQQRPGRGGQPFELVKFRTMRDARGRDGELLPDEERMTRLGDFLRATSIDELPQLVNVLRGDLSVVGPRPLMMAYLPRYTPTQARRHDVQPGITGWAQVNGRNSLTWPEKLALDVWYVEHWSLTLDLRILARTVLALVTREGITSQGHVTMPPLPDQNVNHA
jgi:sugar transferase EpsL